MTVAAPEPSHAPLQIAYLDGRRIRRAMAAGIREVTSAQEHLNQINVYPVADGDTGTNLTLTLNAVICALHRAPSRHAGDTLETIADAALDGARGNSGAILAQFFQGISDSAAGAARLTVSRFVEAVKTGEAYAREALATPVEGTVLTVMRDFSDRLNAASGAERVRDFVRLWTTGLKTARASLAATPNKLEALRKAGVVDAGAEGFVDLLHGIEAFISEGDLDGSDDIEMPVLESADSISAGEVEDLDYRFCTECVITADNIDRRKLKEALIELGGSLVLAGTHSKTRIHIHVNEPAQVFELAGHYGTVSGAKADDMQKQQSSAHAAVAEVAIVTDSAGDLPDDVIERLNIHMVPVRLHLGEQSFLDKVTITADDFYKELASRPVAAKTSQPPPGDFRRQFQFLASHHSGVVSINVTGGSSGTFQSAQSAAERSGATGRIRVVDSRSASVGQGLLAMHAAECARYGMNADQIEESVARMVPRTRIYALLRELSYGVRGGRVSPTIKHIADFLNLSPVISIKRSGKVGAVGMLLGREHALQKFAKFVLKKVAACQYRIGIAHADCEEDALWLRDRIQKAVPHLETLFVTRVGSALGAHVGPEGIAVALQALRPEDDKIRRLD